MDDLELFKFFRQAEVSSTFEFHGYLQHSLARLFADTLSSCGPNSDLIGPIRFVPTVDDRIKFIEYEHYCPGRTMSEIIVRVENEFPVIFAAIPTEEGGYDITLEYYERKFAYV